ncbi:Signal transduction histidine kinase, phosphotransfer (Hpt) domain [Pseudocohnilembus persalinus]|uniref:Signal transduction histidine kinase, phosphotransfer (Hpt) domain n=1 Tax=Pseudocohnilembus persalinus TaxID=266149 RepID=A0A0V0QML4_PSEPJ|nr:Signal transduction histidine kinase, phosphotransfer (Hpt) domain [Pseudocohnilembus persalinus]|eukprot:KRX03313.1 Signal transduction histidine kinase, phosphotransfer (Hpt) domain [Pseudocohnilembus persalinus]
MTDLLDISNFVDEQKAIEQYQTIDIYKQMMAMCIPMTFEEETGLIQELVKAYEQRDYPLIKRHAHTLKGRGLSLFITKLIDKSLNLQKAAEQKNEQLVEDCYSELMEYIPECHRNMCIYCGLELPKPPPKYPLLQFDQSIENEEQFINASTQDPIIAQYLRAKQEGIKFSIYQHNQNKKHQNNQFEQGIKCNIF